MTDLTPEQKYTDDQLLHNCFSMLLHQKLQDMVAQGNSPVLWWKDGFEEPIDENNLCPFMYDLAERIGYKLVDGMWVDRLQALKQPKDKL